jgi:hypothetical protein
MMSCKSSQVINAADKCHNEFQNIQSIEKQSMKSISSEARIVDQKSIEMNESQPLAPWSSDHFNLEGAIDFTIDTKNTSLPNFTEFDREMQCDLPIQSEEVQSFEDGISLEEKNPAVMSPLKEPNFDREILNELQIDKETLPIEVVKNELSTQNIFQCQICNKVLSSKYCLKKHNESQHGMPLEEKNPDPKTKPHYIVKITRPKFGAKLSLDENWKILASGSVKTSQLKEPNFEREIQNESPIDKENVPIDIVENELSTQNIFECKICNRVLSSKYCLKKHYNSIHGVPFEENNLVTTEHLKENVSIGIVKNESSIQNINKRKICNQALSSKKSKLEIPFEENIPVRAKHLIGQGKNIKPETKPKVENTLLSIDKNGRVLACRTCEHCMRDDCGQCTACRDKKKFGGKGTTKKKCSNRFCPLQEALRAKLKSSKESRL